MPYCTQCGAEIQQADSFCTNCGASVEESQEPDDTVQETVSSSDDHSDTQTSTNLHNDSELGRSASGPGNSTVSQSQKLSSSIEATAGSDAVSLLKRGSRFLSTNPATFAIFAVAGVLQLIGGVFGGPVQVVLGLLAGFVIAIGGGVVIYGIRSVVDNQQFDLEALIRRTLDRVILAIIAGILWFILVAIGLILLIIPGIYLMLKFAFVGQSVYLAKANPIEALQNSWSLSEGHLLTIFIILLAIAIPSAILGFVPIVGQPLATTVLTPIGIASLTYLYLDLTDTQQPVS